VTPEAQAKIEKLWKLDFKIIKLYASENTINEKAACGISERVCKSSHKGLISRIY
jgi:hypothetical protein